jgi:hypothetical protein
MAENEYRDRPNKINIQIGWTLADKPEPIYDEIDKTELLMLIAKFKHVCDVAINSNGRISIQGD